MYIRTPRRYRGKRQNIIARRTILMLILIGFLGGTGAYVLQNMSTLQPIVYRLVGTAVVQAQDQAMTIVAPTATATKDPRSDMVSADNFWNQGSVSQALSLYLPILASVPNDMDIHYRVTLGMIIQGSLSDAVEYADMTVNANPYSSDAWAIRAWALDWAGRNGEAIASALQAKDLDVPKTNARALAYLAEAYYGAGQGSRAFQTAEDAINMDDTSAEAYRARGYLSWYINGDGPSALEDFNKAYELAVNTNPALSGLIAVDIAQVQVGEDNPQGAIDILKRVLEVNPDNTQALLWMGTIYMNRMGDAPQGNSFLQRCVDIAPESIDCNYQLGRAQQKNEQLPAAAESYARAIQLGSKEPRHYWWAANAQILLGDCSRALDYMEPGYELANDANNTELISAFDEIIPQCGGNFGSGLRPTEIPTQEATSEPDV